MTVELARESSIMADHIGVTARDGVVTLSGHVDPCWQKQAAAGRVKGGNAAAVEGGRARLTGAVESRSDRELAVDAAWAAKGTACVTNDITGS